MAFTPVEAQPAASGGAVFELGGKPVRARSGRVFSSGLAFDADGDETEDLVALTESSDGRKAEVAFFRGSEQAASETVLVGLPSDLDVHRCSKKMRLARVAPTIVLVEVLADCDKGQKEQWLAVLRLDAGRSKTSPRAPELRLDLRARAPLALRIAAEDRDHDGHADLVVHAKLTDGAPDMEVPLVFFDRPAGYALDPAEPEAALNKLGQKVAAKAKTADGIADALALANLGGAVCEDLGEAVLKTSSGGAKCGEPKFLADALYATGVTHARAGNLGRAAAALDGIAMLGLKSDGGRRAALETALDAKAKPVDATVVRRVGARPSTKPGILAPFAWTSADHLLVAGDSAVTKVDVNTGEENVDADAIAWPRGVGWRAPDSAIELLGASRSCDPPRAARAGDRAPIEDACAPAERAGSAPAADGQSRLQGGEPPDDRARGRRRRRDGDGGHRGLPAHLR